VEQAAQGGPNRKWKWPVEKWKPSPDNRVRELIIAGALYLAEVERREFASETVVVCPGKD
jgi:hypothetical protein